MITRRSFLAELSEPMPLMRSVGLISILLAGIAKHDGPFVITAVLLVFGGWCLGRTPQTPPEIPPEGFHKDAEKQAG